MDQQYPMRYIEEDYAMEKKSDVNLLPPEREKNLNRRAGYAYHLAKIDWMEGCKFGLGIKHFQNKVIVSRVDPGSLSAKSLVVGDRIVDVDGVPVSDKNVARTMLLRSLQKTHTVSLAIERAESMEAKETVNVALKASEMQPPSVALNSDVIDIIKRQKKKMDAKQVEAPKQGIMRRSENKDRKVSLNLDRQEVVIATDHEGKVLRRTKQ